jgi:hypothetical protein
MVKQVTKGYRAGNVSFKTSMSNCDKAVFRAENVTLGVSSPTCDKTVLFLVPEV